MRLPTCLRCCIPWALTLILIAAPLSAPVRDLACGRWRAHHAEPGGAAAGICAAGEAQAQPLDDASIFRRFSTPPQRSDRRLRFIEVPLALRPQTDPGAEASENIGFGYTVGFQPFNRAFSSVGFHFARMEWRPSDPAIASVDVKQIDLSQSLNFWVGRTVFFSVGLGLGLLDSLVVNQDGTFEHNVVPYLPLRTGATVVLGNSVFVGLTVASTPFFGTGPVAGQSRLSLGLGWTY